MRNYRVTLDNSEVFNVNATHWHQAGGGAFSFFRRHPSSPDEGTPYNPEGPYFEPINVAMFASVKSIELIEEE